MLPKARDWLIYNTANAVCRLMYVVKCYDRR